jgi:CBS domain-containing protein
MSLASISLRDIISKTPPIISPNDVIAKARRLMIRHGVKTVVIVKDDKPIGILTVNRIRNILFDKELKTRPLDNLMVSDFMETEFQSLSLHENLITAAEALLTYRSPAVVVEPDGSVYGIVDAYDLLGPYSRLSKSDTVVSDVYYKDPPVASPSHSIYNVMDKMLKTGYEAVVIIDKMKRPIGIITSTDLATIPPVIYQRTSHRIIRDSERRSIYIKYSMPVAEDVMSSPVFVANMDDLLIDAALRMYVESIGTLPVVDDANRLVGIITKYDILKDLVRWEKH